MIRKLVFILIIVALALAGSVLFQKGIVSFYDVVNLGVQDFRKSDLGNFISKVAERISLPDPLAIGGRQTGAVLQKAKVVAQTNLQRQSNGDLPALKENAKLTAAALAKAKDMFSNQYFEHTSPANVTLEKLIENHGYEYVIIGENLILGNFIDEKDMVQKWMGSPGHRANILNSRFVEIGVAVVKGDYKGESVWIGVQEFGLPLSACPVVPEALRSNLDKVKAQLDALAATVEAKKKEVIAQKPGSEQHNALVDEYNAMIQEYNRRLKEFENQVEQYNIKNNAFNACVKGK